MSRALKVVIAAGGTGGHFYPAIALAKELTARGCPVLFVTRENPLTIASLKKENLKYEAVHSSPWVGQSALKISLGIPRLTKSVLSSLKILNKFGAERVVGFGSYVSAPVILAAALKGIPVDLHEQNPRPGWANRFASLFARNVAVSFPESGRAFGGKAVLTGNLLRPELFHLDRAQALSQLGLQKNLQTALIFGGSGGAKSINAAIVQGMQKFVPLRERLQFFHIAGSATEADKVSKRYQELNLSAVVRDYCHRMDWAYAAADFVVCRAGATTLSELLAIGLPAILVPYPYAGGHQAANAQVLENLGSAVVIQESPSLAADIAGAVDRLSGSAENLERMRRACKKFPVDLKSAVQKMADLVLG